MNHEEKKHIIISNHYTLLSCLFCSIVLLGNLFALKTTIIYGHLTPSGMICFPFTFSLCDIITEVYGNKAATKTIHMGLLILLIYFITLHIVTIFPAAPGWEKQEAWNEIFSMSPSIFLGTIIAYYLGEKINSRMLSALRYMFNIKAFFNRSLISTFIGVTIDTLVFNLVAFLWILPFYQWVSITISQLILKLLYEAIGSSIASMIVPFLKKQENLDPIKPRVWIDKYQNNTQDN